VQQARSEAQGRSAAIALEAEGEAEASCAKLEAQARGEYEIPAKKGEGLRAIVEGRGDSEAAFRSMMREHLDHLAATASRAIADIEFDTVTVRHGGRGGASGFLSGLGRSMPPLMNVVPDIGGVELPDYLGRMVVEGVQPPAAPPAEAALAEGAGGASAAPPPAPGAPGAPGAADASASSPSRDPGNPRGAARPAAHSRSCDGRGGARASPGSARG